MASKFIFDLHIPLQILPYFEIFSTLYKESRSMLSHLENKNKPPHPRKRRKCQRCYVLGLNCYISNLLKHKTCRRCKKKGIKCIQRYVVPGYPKLTPEMSAFLFCLLASHSRARCQTIEGKSLTSAHKKKEMRNKSLQKNQLQSIHREEVRQIS